MEEKPPRKRIHEEAARLNQEFGEHVMQTFSAQTGGQKLGIQESPLKRQKRDEQVVDDDSESDYEQVAGCRWRCEGQMQKMVFRFDTVEDDDIGFPLTPASVAKEHGLFRLSVPKTLRSFVAHMQTFTMKQLKKQHTTSIKAQTLCLGCQVKQAFERENGGHREGMVEYLNLLVFSRAYEIVFGSTPSGTMCHECAGVMPLGKHPVSKEQMLVVRSRLPN